MSGGLSEQSITTGRVMKLGGSTLSSLQRRAKRKRDPLTDVVSQPNRSPPARPVRPPGDLVDPEAPPTYDPYDDYFDPDAMDLDHGGEIDDFMGLGKPFIP